MSRHVFSVSRGKTLLDGKPFLAHGLRCSNALFSDESTQELIDHLASFAGCGVNTISVFFMGNRFGDIRGYREDASLDPVYAARMGRIIEAADARGVVVLVGCLYWSTSRAKWGGWTQAEANKAVANTVRWLAEQGYRNTFVDVDNEGMALREAGFDNRPLVLAAKAVDPLFMVATNFVGTPPPEADLTLHHSDRAPGKPHIESEGVPENAPGSYWGHWSRKMDPVNRYRRNEEHYNYINVGLYTEEMKQNQRELAAWYWDRGEGYLLASTWLQAVPPLGPHHGPGGSGRPGDPGIRWWLEFLKETHGPYAPA